MKDSKSPEIYKKLYFPIFPFTTEKNFLQESDSGRKYKNLRKKCT